MNKRSYAQFMSEIKTPDTAVEKAIAGMNESDTETAVLSIKPKRRGYLSVAATTAVLCLVLIAGIIYYPFGTEKENVFVINAGAAVVNNFEPVKLGELKCEFSSLGLCFNDANELTGVTMCENLKFPIFCKGENIESVTYSVKGKGYFAVSDSDAHFSGKQYYKEPAVSVFAGEETVGSFTTEFSDHAQDVKLCLFTSAWGADFCNAYNFLVDAKKGEMIFGKGFDYQQMYYDLFTADEYCIEITAKFEDGTTQTKTLGLIIEKTDEESAAEQDATLIVSAKLAE